MLLTSHKEMKLFTSNFSCLFVRTYEISFCAWHMLKSEIIFSLLFLSLITRTNLKLSLPTEILTTFLLTHFFLVEFFHL